MQGVQGLPRQPQPVGLLAWLGRLAISLLVPILTFIVLWQVFIFLRDGNAPQLVIALVAIIWGVGGVALLFVMSNWVVERMGARWRTLLQPFVFIGPALAILTWYLLLPTLRTLYLSFFNASSRSFVLFRNYIFAFTNAAMLESFRNNLLWLIFGTLLSVIFGLLIAVLADRSRFEKIAKSLIFLPMAISFVGAGVIWKFVYYYNPPGEEQIGLLNAFITFLGTTASMANDTSLNTFMPDCHPGLAADWLAMVLLCCVKACRKSSGGCQIDGANEIQIFSGSSSLYPGTIVTVATTILIATLKIFDIVFVMTNGLFGTEVMASQQYKQMFKFQDFGRGSAVAVVLLIAVAPVMLYNLRQFREREGF
jgi:alpha-glucoside transport system permease protein